MAKTVVGFFHTGQAAKRASDNLMGAGFGRDEISIVAGDSQNVKETPNIGPVHGVGGDAVEGEGAVMGGIAGLIAGLVLVVIPGVGPLLAVGPIAGALAGMGIGAAAGGVIGWLGERGVSEDEAQYYEEGLRRGGVIVSVDATEKEARKVRQIMDDAGAVDLLEQAEVWRAAGWMPAERVRRAG